MALTAKLEGGSFTGVDGLQMTILELAVEINKGVNGTAVIDGLNWTNEVGSAGTGGFTATPVTVRIPTGPSTTQNLTFGYEGTLFRARGKVQIDIFGFISGTVGFTFETRAVDARVGTQLLEDATLTLITFTVDDLFVGVPGGIGFRIDQGALVLAALKPKPPATGTPDNRSWTALRASLRGASFEGVDNVTLTIGATVPLLVELNMASVGATALDWTSSLDLDDDGTYGEHTVNHTGNDDLSVEDANRVKHKIDFADEVLSASGDADINLFGIVTGKVAFAFSRRNVDVNLLVDADPVDDPELDEAVLTTLHIEVEDVFIGFDGTGFSLSAGQLAIAMLKPRAPPAGQTPTQPDPRSWTAVSAHFEDAEFVGIDGLTLRADLLDVDINQGAGGATPPAALNWTTALRFGDTGAYGDTLVIEGTDPDSDEEDVTIAHTGNLLQLAGTATIELEGFVFVHGDFAMVKGADTLVTDTGSPTPIKVSLLRVGLHDVDVFAGVGDPDADNDGEIDSDATIQATGVKLTNVELGLALMKQVGPTGLPVANAKSYMALTGSGNAALVGIPGFELAGSLQVNLNTGKNPLNTNPLVIDPVVDFTKLPGGKMTVQTGPDDPDVPGPAPSVDLTFSGRLLAIAGSARISIDEFAFVAADFAFTKGQPRTVTLENGTTGQVTALEIGASNGRAFFGVGGPYWVDDDDEDLVYDDIDDEGAMGLVISDVNVALILATPTPTSTALANYKSFTALKAGGSVELVGIEGFTIAVTNLSVELNDAKAKPTAPVGFVPQAIDFSAMAGGGLPIQVGPDPDGPGGDPAPVVKIDFDAKTFRASGTFTLAIGEFVYVTGNAAFEKVNPTSMTAVNPVPSAPATTVNVEGMKIGASGVNIFLGTGGPYFADRDGDGVFETDPNGDDRSGAVGLKIENVSFALAMLKPVVAAGVKSPRSFFALKRDRDEIALIGIDGVTISATGLSIEVNSSSDSTVVAPALPPVLNFAAKPLVVNTGPSTSETINFGSRLLRASGRVDLALEAADLQIGADVFFESATKPNGTKVTKIAFGDLNFGFGGFSIKTGDQKPGQTPVPGHIQEVNGKLVLLPGGLAGEFTLHDLSFDVGNASAGLTFNADEISVAVNTTNRRVLETFLLPDGPDAGDEPDEEVLDLGAGPMFRLEVLDLDIAVKVAGKDAVTLHGDFSIEQLTIPTGPTTSRKVLKIGATDVGIATPFIDAAAGEVSLSGGQGAFVVYSAVPGQPTAPTGIAGVLSGTFVMATPILQAGSEVILRFNTMAGAVNETVTVGGSTLRVDVPGNTFQLTFRNVSVEFPPFLSLKGDFTFGSSDTNGNNRPDRFIYGAKNVELFLGAGPYRLADGSVNPDAIGVLVSGATVGVVKLAGANDDPAFTTDDTFAIFASGTAALIGLEGLTVSGTIRVLINHTGQVIVDSILLPGAPGTPDERILMPFTTNRYVEQFEAGFTAQGTPTPPEQQLAISAAGIFTLRGSVRFSVQPNGVVDAEVVNAAVEISMPLGGNLTEVFALEGNARFMFGGGQGFQLIDFRVTGFELFGEQIVALPTPAAQLRAPVADLAKPFNGQRVFINTLTGTIDVLFRDYNIDTATGLPIALNVDSILDTSAEFAIVGQAAAGVTVNGRPTQDATNPNLFHYSYTGLVLGGRRPGSVPHRRGPLPPEHVPERARRPEHRRGRVLPDLLRDRAGRHRGAHDDPGASAGADGEAGEPVQRLDRQPGQFATRAVHRRRLRPGLRRRHRPGHRRRRDQAVRRGRADRPRPRPRRLRQRHARAAARRPEHVPLLPAAEGRLHAAEHVHGGRDRRRRSSRSAGTSSSPSWQVKKTDNTLSTRGHGDRHVHGRPELPRRRDRAGRQPRRRPAEARRTRPIGLAGMTFKGGKLVLTIAIEMDEASLAFGGGSQPGAPPSQGAQTQQQNSGAGVFLNQILGTFDVAVDMRQGGGRDQRSREAARGVQRHRQVGPRASAASARRSRTSSTRPAAACASATTRTTTRRRTRAASRSSSSLQSGARSSSRASASPA